MRRYLHLYRTMASVFHSRLKPLVMLSVLGAFRAIAAVSSVADRVCYRGWRSQSLDRPVFIVGNPRSGTTFLHRLLLGAGELAALELWEMMLPSITARTALGRVVPRLDKVNPAQYHCSDAHETSLRGIETDDLAWFFHTLDGPFAWAYFWAWTDRWGSPLARRSFGIGTVEDDERLFAFNEMVWKKNLYLKGKARALVKSSMLTFRLPALLNRYPDARLIYVVRDPVETIPSGLSLLAGALANAFDIWERTSEEDQHRWTSNLYRASEAMFTGFCDRYTAGVIPDANLLVVRYPDLITDLETTIGKVLDFIEITPPQEFLDEVREQGAKQRRHTSKHGYSPEQFGLTAQQIRDDLAVIYQTFDLADDDTDEVTVEGVLP